MGEKKTHIRTILEGLLVAGVVTLILVFSGFEKIEGWILNTQFSLRGEIPPKSPIVIVSIDEDSFDELELQWPWPRSIHAQFLHILQQGHPAIIGFDVLFTEPSQLGLEDDEALGQAVRHAGNVVLGAALSQVERDFFFKENLNPPIPIIRKHSAGYGPVNLPLDDDAFVRRAQPNFTFQNKSTPSFDGLIFQKAKNAGLTEAILPEGPFFINFRGGPRTFRTIPFHRVINGEISPETFRNKIVLIGATSPLLHDVYATPFATNGNMPGVELHANVLETMLQGIPIQRVSRPMLLLLTFAMGIAGMWLAHHFSPISGLFVVGCLMCATLVASYLGLTYLHLWLDFVPLPATLFLAYATATVESYVKERREKQRLSQYFSPSVLTDILGHPADQPLQSQRRIVTVLFSDIRNFSSISEQLTPEETAAFLRVYFTEMTDVVFRHGGMVDKYMGDAIMALFNVPFDQPNHARQAIGTAFELQNRVAALGQQFQERYARVLTCGIGIHTGEAIVGTMGSKQRFEYTAIGDTINLGARLESLSKKFPANIILSETTYQEIRYQYITRSLGSTEIQGREKPERIYTALETDGRQEPRFAIEGHVELEQQGKVYRGKIKNLSQLGMALQSISVILESEEICPVRLCLHCLTNPISLQAKVVWQHHQHAGFIFLEIPPPFYAMMKEYCTIKEGSIKYHSKGS